MMADTQGPKKETITMHEWKPGHFILRGELYGMSFSLQGEDPKELLSVFANSITHRISRL